MQLLPKLRARSVDLILCNLPYGATECRWDRRIDLAALWRQYQRVLKPAGAAILFANARLAIALANAAPEGWFRYEMVWDKVSRSGWLNARRRPMPVHEMLLVFAPAMPRYFSQGLRPCPAKRRQGASEVYGEHYRCTGGRLTGYATTILRFPREAKAKTAVKPLALLDWIIRSYTRPGETVLDNAMGLGSTGIAAVRCGRLFIGMEIDQPKYREAARLIRQALSAEAAR